MAGLSFAERVVEQYSYKQRENGPAGRRLAHVVGHTVTLDVAVFSWLAPDSTPTFQAVTAERGRDGALATHWSAFGEDVTWGPGGIIVQFGDRDDINVTLPFGTFRSGQRLPAMINGELVRPFEENLGIPVVPVPRTEQALAELLLAKSLASQAVPV